MMMMMMDCFCGMVDQRKAFSLISSQDHWQRSSPSRISDTPRAGFEPAHSLSSGLVEWSCAVVITTTPRTWHVFLYLSFVYLLPYSGIIMPAFFVMHCTFLLFYWKILFVFYNISIFIYDFISLLMYYCIFSFTFSNTIGALNKFKSIF